jgi:hypothetical protein
VQMMVWQVTSSSYCNALIEVFVAGIQWVNAAPSL